MLETELASSQSSGTYHSTGALDGSTATTCPLGSLLLHGCQFNIRIKPCDGQHDSLERSEKHYDESLPAFTKIIQLQKIFIAYCFWLRDRYHTLFQALRPLLRVIFLAPRSLLNLHYMLFLALRSSLHIIYSLVIPRAQDSGGWFREYRRVTTRMAISGGGFVWHCCVAHLPESPGRLSRPSRIPLHI